MLFPGVYIHTREGSVCLRIKIDKQGFLAGHATVGSKVDGKRRLAYAALEIYAR